MEEWRPVVGYEGQYEVSSIGRVRALTFRNRYSMTVLDEPKLLHPHLSDTRKRYFKIALYKNNKRQNYSVHTLVLLAFVGPCPPGFEAAHLNGNSKHNSADNLCWVSRSENMNHKWRHGTAQHGELAVMAKLTWNDPAEIKRLHKEGWANGDIARKFNVSKTSIRNVLHGRTWTGKPHLTPKVTPEEAPGIEWGPDMSSGY